VEVSEESRRGSKTSLDIAQPVSQAVDSYRVPVIFDKDNRRQESDASAGCGKFSFCGCAHIHATVAYARASRVSSSGYFPPTKMSK